MVANTPATDPASDVAPASVETPTARRVSRGGSRGGRYPHQLIVLIDDDTHNLVGELAQSTGYTRSVIVRAALKHGLPQASRLARGRRLRPGD